MHLPVFLEEETQPFTAQAHIHTEIWGLFTTETALVGGGGGLSVEAQLES